MMLSDDQDRLLDEATAVVKEQAFYLKRAIDGDNTRDSLKYASNLIYELATSRLSPKNYYELYMLVFQEMQHLHGYFSDRQRHGRKMVDLYESVQHAGNIVPRLYLVATVGSAYIKSKEAPASEILRDVSELSKGVQHPLRGLFLRYYLSQMMKDKLPDVGSGYEGEGGSMDDAFEFIYNNFTESNRLWVRIQNQGPTKDRSKREKERHDLRVLVGANLVRMSQLEGMTQEYYARVALPKVLEHITAVKDTMSQQYLFESMIQVFPDEFHIRTLEQLLCAYSKACPSVDMKPIVVTLMNRLANYLQESEGSDEAPSGIDVFSLFRTHLSQILERALTPTSAATGLANQAAPTVELGPILEIQAAFMQFTISLYPSKVHYVDLILGSTVEILRKYCNKGGLAGAGSGKVVDLLSCPLKSLSLSVLSMENYDALMEFLDFGTRKQVAMSIVNFVNEENQPLATQELVASLFNYISPLIKDDPDGAQDTADKDRFASEQQQVAKLAHQIQNEDIDTTFQVITGMRGFFGQGGPKRLVFTLPATFFAAMALIPRIRENEQSRAEAAAAAAEAAAAAAEQGEEVEEPEPVPAPATTVKKVFQFLHKTVTALQKVNPESALNLWLIASKLSDDVDRSLPEPGSFEPICFEFLTQAVMCFEEEISETTKQYANLFNMVGCITQISCLELENFDTVSQKLVQHAARLMKKHLQIRAVSTCSHLFWCQARRDGTRVRECLQKCLKITTALVESDASHVGLWVEMLDKYVYYYEAECEEVSIQHIQTLLNLCQEHISYAEKDSSSQEEAAKAKAHFREAAAQLRLTKTSGPPEAQARYAELVLP